MLNKRLETINKNLMDYFNFSLDFNYTKEMNFVFDIEACAINNKTEMLTYSIAFMDCMNNNDICYWINNVDSFLDILLLDKEVTLNLYAHNCLYDIKPFLLRFVERFGNKSIKKNTVTKKEYNKFEDKWEVLEYSCNKTIYKQIGKFEYELIMKNGIFYKCTLKGEKVIINFYDTFKLIPFSLKKASKDFLGLELSKEGLDYEKERSLVDKLTLEEFKYIYEDVFALKYLVKLLKFDGMKLNNETIKYSAMTTSSQAMKLYKDSLVDDYLENINSFEDEYVKDCVDNILFVDKGEIKKNKFKYADKLFRCLFPEQNQFIDSWQRHSYYGGLSTVEYDNVKKYSKYKNKHGVVLDVNSLYPFIMYSRLLPYGTAFYKEEPWEDMNDEYKKINPLYIQEITIHKLDVKKNKMAFLQVKDNKDFNGRLCIKNNILNGERVSLKFRLTNVMLKLLFECYNVGSYELGGHMAFQGTNDLFKSYIDKWSKVKQENEGALRAFAKLMQNGLYGKFGMCGLTEKTEFVNDDGIFTIKHLHTEIVSDTVYLPMATFITSYAKEYLVNAINTNYERFMYCDTDSLHLFGTLEEVKGVEIGEKIYGLWDNEFTFDDFIYIGSKRYAERDIVTKKWNVKCCGLSDSILKQVDDISTFTVCKHEPKDLNKMNIYTNDKDIYYYYDKECTKKIGGMYKSKKAKIIKNGTIILEQPYKIYNENFNMGVYDDDI